MSEEKFPEIKLRLTISAVVFHKVVRIYLNICTGKLIKSGFVLLRFPMRPGKEILHFYILEQAITDQLHGVEF